MPLGGETLHAVERVRRDVRASSCSVRRTMPRKARWRSTTIPAPSARMITKRGERRVARCGAVGECRAPPRRRAARHRRASGRRRRSRRRPRQGSRAISRRCRRQWPKVKPRTARNASARRVLRNGSILLRPARKTRPAPGNHVVRLRRSAGPPIRPPARGRRRKEVSELRDGGAQAPSAPIPRRSTCSRDCALRRSGRSRS